MPTVAKPTRSDTAPPGALPATRWAFRILGGGDAGTLSCGFMTKGRGWDSRGARRPSLSAVLCLRGTALYDGRHAVGPGDLLLRFTGVAHDLEITSAPWHECWISLGEPVEALLLATGLIDHRVPVRRAAVDAVWLAELAAAITPLERAPEHDLPHHLVHLQGLLMTLLRHAPADGLDLERASRLLAEPEPSLAVVAQRCGLDYTRFRREFRRRTGVAPGAYRQRRLLERARRELLDRTRPVQEIAAGLGYANPFAFSAAFRRATGLSPRAWRQGR